MSGCPVAKNGETAATSAPLPAAAGTCPYKHDRTQSGNESTKSEMPLNSELPPNQKPSPGQTKLLSTHRVKSSIPRGDAKDESDAETWQYPSQQMFYNAMKRKGYSPREEDMDSVVAIHNAVNERTWYEILKWEKAHCEQCPAPKLLWFKGRPADLSPKARFLGMLGYELPFDRHDWVVDRCGEHVRYVIDYYSGAPDPDSPKPVAVHIDARPALDSAGAVFDRFKRFVLGTSSTENKAD